MAQSPAAGGVLGGLVRMEVYSGGVEFESL
jgi:hypothetical protein